MKSKLNLEMGARNNAKQEREANDFYATDPKTVELFIMQLFEDGVRLPGKVWECACGMGHISEKLKHWHEDVVSSDLINRNYGVELDFLKATQKPKGVNTILTNPPYKHATKFVLKAFELMEFGDYLVLYLKDRFLEGEKRYKEIYKQFPPKYVYCHVERQKIAMNGDFNKYCESAGSQFYIWVIWQKGYKGEPVFKVDK